MDFFNSLIDDVFSLTDVCDTKSYTPCKPWKDEGSSRVILQRDSAFELSGTGFNLVTGRAYDDGITVCGEDLCDINENRSFARISVVSISDVEDEQKAYNLIRKIEYVKYHYFPEGYMLRSASNHSKEAVRVSAQAVKNGIDFRKTGSLLIEKYKEIPLVRSVKVFFITDKNADYKKIEALASKSHAVTETLNHVMNSINFDCNTCNLKPVCDEVEGMRELHFRNRKM